MSDYGPKWDAKNDCCICRYCSSKDLEYYDDGEGYPPNILCNNCGEWNQ